MTKLPPESIAPTYNAIINQMYEDFIRVQAVRKQMSEASNIHYLINNGHPTWARWYWDDVNETLACDYVNPYKE